MRTNVKTCLKIAPGIFILFLLLFIFIFKYLTYARDSIVHLGNIRELASQVPINVQTSTDNSNFLHDPPTYDDDMPKTSCHVYRGPPLGFPPT